MGHLCARYSMKGTLRERGRDLYTGKPKDEFFEIRKMPCKRISLSVGTLLGTWRGFVCRDF